MPSDLEALLEAASQLCDLDDPCSACAANRELEDLAPTLAREVLDVAKVLEEAKHFADHHSNLTGAASLFAAAGSALARWAKLGEEEEREA